MTRLHRSTRTKMKLISVFIKHVGRKVHVRRKSERTRFQNHAYAKVLSETSPKAKASVLYGILCGASAFVTFLMKSRNREKRRRVQKRLEIV